MHFPMQKTGHWITNTAPNTEKLIAENERQKEKVNKEKDWKLKNKADHWWVGQFKNNVLFS